MLVLMERVRISGIFVIYDGVRRKTSSTPLTEHLYTAITNLVKRGITTVDPYNILESLESNEGTRGYAKELSLDKLHELMDMSDVLVRQSVEEYKMLVSNVLDAAFRRDTFQKLKDCQALCYNRSEVNVERRIYDIIDDVMTEYSVVDEIPQFCDVVDELWKDIEKHQDGNESGIPFKFPTLNIFDHIVITEIYNNCFFARTVIPMPYEIKLNGQLSDDWCVGDQITCTYENTYYDAENQKVEVDFLSVEPSDWQMDPNVCYKPVIYLYPEVETEVSVKLILDGKLTCTYPSYHDGWRVTASPDGTLTDAKGQTYNYLYWEGETNTRWDMSEGFCVRGEDTAVFLEETLEKLGLNRTEANEFIVYWLPLMERNPYNIISFQTNVYTDAAELQIDPAPDTLIRVFIAWKAADSFVELPPQELEAPNRTGFTVVEWGGTEIIN